MSNAIDKLAEFLRPEKAKKRYFQAINSLSLLDLSQAKEIEPELLYLPQIIPVGKTVIDIGSHAGEYLYILENSGKFSHVIGIEPNPNLASRLQRLFRKCQIYNLALSNTNEQKKLKIPLINGVYFESRGTFENFSELDEDDQKTITVRATTLDDFVSDRAIQNIGLLKIDVEGHEMKIFQGASKTIMRNRPTILVEIEQRHHQEPISNIFQHLLDYGYRGYIYNMADMRFMDLKDFSSTEHQQLTLFKTTQYLNNFLFIPEESELNVNSLNEVIARTLKR
jgi:FkbM family methyltransferase